VQEKASIANHVGEIVFSQTTDSYFFCLSLSRASIWLKKNSKGFGKINLIFSSGTDTICLAFATFVCG